MKAFASDLLGSFASLPQDTQSLRHCLLALDAAVDESHASLVFPSYKQLVLSTWWVKNSLRFKSFTRGMPRSGGFCTRFPWNRVCSLFITEEFFWFLSLTTSVPLLGFSLSSVPGIHILDALPSKSISFFLMAIISIFFISSHWDGLFLLWYSSGPLLFQSLICSPRFPISPFILPVCVLISFFRFSFIQPEF